MVVDTSFGAVRTPSYCAICGSRLVPSENIQGYDPYTGDPVAEQSLHCSNPTISVQNGLLSNKTITTYHPTWALSGNAWVQE